MQSNNAVLIFVYNADSGVFNLAADVAHKIFSPQTYACNLCAITHSTFKMRDEWRRYLDTLTIPFTFLHADEFKTEYKIEVELPAVFITNDAKPEIIIDSAAINQCRSIDDLKRIINEKISERGLEI
ncbi:MAG TPA: hypothetical protein VK308_02540 [Pyrinomonadaceae bacterium]|nr:hypothetical protein [Pyrinomonadaceae bacterium]